MVDLLYHDEREVLDIQSGVAHNIALVRVFNTNTSQIFTWGGGWYGKLGHGSERFQLKPKPLKSLLSEKIVQIACGGNSTCALNSSGILFTWGYNKHGQLGLGKDNSSLPTVQNGGGVSRPSPAKVPTRGVIIYVSMGSNHTLVLDDVGQCFSTGSNECGQLGTSEKMGTGAERFEFKKIESFSFSKICAGGEHSLAISSGIGMLFFIL